MNKTKILFAVTAALFLQFAVNAQDVRTLETRVADLLAKLPANNQKFTANLIEEMYSLGDEGTALICQQVVSAGTGDDTKARYAVSTLTSHLSADRDNARKSVWEKQCIRFMKAAGDREVRAFFMKQLNLIGSDLAAATMTDYVRDAGICDDAVMVLKSSGSEASQKVLSDAVTADTCPCAAQILVALADMQNAKALQSYLKWYEKGNRAEQSAALYALANTGDPAALPVLLSAAETARFKWEPTGAVQALLLYSKNRGLAGDERGMKKITDLVISKSTAAETAGQRLAAMSIIVAVKGEDALPVLLRAADDPDVAIRGGAMRLAGLLPGQEATRKWMKKYNKVSPVAKPEILFMLGERGDDLAVPLMLMALNDPSMEIASEAVAAVAKLEGSKAVDPILAWILKYDNEGGHRAAATALTTVLDSSSIYKVAASLPASRGHGTVTLLWLLAWSGKNEDFNTVLSYVNSPDLGVRAAALGSLGSLASWEDQPALISLLQSVTERQEIEEVQRALANAAMKTGDSTKRSDTILRSLDKNGDKLKLIPLLAQTGGSEALKRVAYEFENGNAETRDICFDALAHWSDHSAAQALYDICASGNKTFGMPAFDAYLRMVSVAALTPERKLLLIKKIAPLAAAPDAKAEMIALAASLGIRPSGFFISPYLADPSEEVRSAAEEALNDMKLPPDEVFVPMFNGKDLSGWQGLAGNPVTRAAMKPKELATKQKEADLKMLSNWSVRDGMIWFNGSGDNLCSIKEYGDFELYLDWRITKNGDSGIYLRGSPQVQIWDTSRTEAGAQVGSGGLYNNEKNTSVPLMVEDNPVGEWNTFRILMTGEKVSVWLNGELVTDDVILENYWNRAIPIFEKGPIELQAHGTDLSFRDIYIREINTAEYDLTDEEKASGFVSLFNGRNLDGWTGDKNAYYVEDGLIMTRTGLEHGGNIYTQKEYSDFTIRFEFQLAKDSNNGLGIRAPLTGDAAYVGMEIQIIDNDATIYGKLADFQYHGSVYGVIPAKRCCQKPLGEWNSEEVTAQGTRIKVILNGTVILDADIAEARDNGTIDHQEHPGLRNRSGHIGLLYHETPLKFRNIRIKEL